MRRILVAACLGAAAGCAAIGAPGGDTTVHIPLESGSYLLAAASFHFSGPEELSVTADSAEPSLVVELEPGVYQVELEPGWQLERVAEDGSRHRVDALLAGSAVRELAVVPGDTAELRFEFLVTSP